MDDEVMDDAGVDDTGMDDTGVDDESVGNESVGIVARIGGTPLVRLRRVTDGLPEAVAVYAKAEHLNPGGSVKDRPARAIVQAGRASGAFGPGQTLLDATSGNTGIAYALLGAALGFPVALCLPANASPARKHTLEAYGAELILTDPMEGTDGAQARAQALADEAPDRYFYADQYRNDANWRAHYATTGPEIWAQTDERVTHFVAGLGTTGTFTGVVRYLKAQRAAVEGHAMQPATPLHGLEGLKHLPTARVPGIYDDTLPDALHHVTTEAAQAMTRRLAREEGLLVGPSAGANVRAALDVAATLDAGVVVTILCDTGLRYLDANAEG